MTRVLQPKWKTDRCVPVVVDVPRNPIVNAKKSPVVTTGACNYGVGERFDLGPLFGIADFGDQATPGIYLRVLCIGNAVVLIRRRRQEEYVAGSALEKDFERTRFPEAVLILDAQLNLVEIVNGVIGQDEHSTVGSVGWIKLVLWRSCTEAPDCPEVGAQS